jgi:1,4-alpha-glucan branching enzyme
MIKTSGDRGTASVTFTIDPAVEATRAAVCGDWNDWSPERDVMEQTPGGGFMLTVKLQSGRSYRFRYLLDGSRWENDAAADAYVPNDFGTDDSVVDLTDLAAQLAPTGPTTKSAAKKGTATKKTGTVKEAAAKRAAGEADTTKKRAPAKKAGKKTDSK